MGIVLYDVNGKERIYGDYKSIVDCMVHNKYYLRFIDFSNIDFRNEDFSGANFRNADFSGVIFRNANFEGVNFSNVDFSYANFKWSNFSGGDFSYANFSGVNFRSIDFKWSNFNKVKLNGADLRYLNFFEVDFTNVDLRGIDISCKMLYNIHCSDAKLDYTLLKIQGSRHLFCGYGGMIRIGCEYHTVDDWLAYGAYTSTYSESEQKEYMEYLRIYAKIWEGER